MGFRIIRSDDPKTNKTTLSIQGSLTTDYADLLEAECSRLLSDPARKICIELKDLTFLDEAAAKILAGLRNRPGVCFEGNELFTQQMIDSAAEDP